MGEVGVVGRKRDERWLRAGVLVAVLSAVLVTGCSGSHGSPKAISSTQFAASFTVAQTSFKNRTTTLQEQGRTALTQGQKATLAFFDHLLVSTRTAAHDFAALAPPASVKTAYEVMVKALNAQVSALEAAIQAQNHNDPAKVAASLRRYAEELGNWLQADKSLQTAIPALAHPVS